MDLMVPQGSRFPCLVPLLIALRRGHRLGKARWSLRPERSRSNLVLPKREANLLGTLYRASHMISYNFDGPTDSFQTLRPLQVAEVNDRRMAHSVGRPSGARLREAPFAAIARQTGECQYEVS